MDQLTRVTTTGVDVLRRFGRECQNGSSLTEVHLFGAASAHCTTGAKSKYVAARTQIADGIVVDQPAAVLAQQYFERHETEIPIRRQEQVRSPRASSQTKG